MLISLRHNKLFGICLAELVIHWKATLLWVGSSLIRIIHHLVLFIKYNYSVRIPRETKFVKGEIWSSFIKINDHEFWKFRDGDSKMAETRWRRWLLFMLLTLGTSRDWSIWLAVIELYCLIISSVPYLRALWPRRRSRRIICWRAFKERINCRDVSSFYLLSSTSQLPIISPCVHLSISRVEPG